MKIVKWIVKQSWLVRECGWCTMCILIVRSFTALLCRYCKQWASPTIRAASDVCRVTGALMVCLLRSTLKTVSSVSPTTTGCLPLCVITGTQLAGIAWLRLLCTAICWMNMKRMLYGLIHFLWSWMTLKPDAAGVCCGASEWPGDGGLLRVIFWNPSNPLWIIPLIWALLLWVVC